MATSSQHKDKLSKLLPAWPAQGMSTQNSGTSSTTLRNNQGRRRPSIDATLVRGTYALREAIDKMASVEEALLDHVNYLTVGLENCLQEINLLHQRLNILALPPMEPIFPQEDWNLAQ